MQRQIAWLIAAALCLGAASNGWAQQPDGPQPDGSPPGGPPGGFSGPPPGMFGFGPPGRAARASDLLALREVRDELHLTDEQSAAIDKSLGSMQEELQKLMGEVDFREMEQLDDDQRRQRFDDWLERTERVVTEANDKLVAQFDDKQAERLTQLKRQRAGARGLLDDETADALELTDEQRQKLEALAPPPGPFGGFGPPTDANKLLADALAILTDDQRTTWTKLTGAEFKFPAFEGFGRGRSGFGGPGGPGRETRKILAKFDANKDGWLNQDERKAAREELAASGGGRQRGPGGFGGPGGGGPFGGFGGPRGGGPGGGRRDGPGGGRGGPFGRVEPGTPGPHVDPTDVEPISSADLYDPQVVRTLFLQFDDDKWEAELEAFHGTDVDVPATLTVDGQQYPGVGVRFRGMSSYMMLPSGSKRSLNLSLDMVDDEQRLLGHKTLNLLNGHEDPTFLHTVLYSHIARQYIAAPKANFVHVVVNGESWGLYASAEQFDKIMLAENYGSGEGARWKVSGSPGARGGLEYLGEEIEPYRSRFEIKGNDNDESWKSLIDLCRTLNETPPEKLVDALEPMLDVEEALKFLAIDNALINSDGYWVRASDYCLYRDPAGKFHVIPHDMNEAMQPPMGPGRGGGRGRRGRRGPAGADGPQAEPQPGASTETGASATGANDDRPRGGGPGGPPGTEPGPGGGRPQFGFGLFGGPRGPASYDLDPLVGLDDSSKPLRSKLLAVPELRAKYLAHVRDIAEKQLDWDVLGPWVARQTALIEPCVQADTRKLSSLEDFKRNTAKPDGEGEVDRHNLYEFAQKRREYLLNYEPPSKETTDVGP